MKYRVFIGFIFLEIVVLLFFYIHSEKTVELRAGEIVGKLEIVKKLMLTDFSLWTDARYARHPSQADLFTPFQDFPGSIEHFPSGSLVTPVNVKGKTSIILTVR